MHTFIPSLIATHNALSPLFITVSARQPVYTNGSGDPRVPIGKRTTMCEGCDDSSVLATKQATNIRKFVMNNASNTFQVVISQC